MITNAPMQKSDSLGKLVPWSWQVRLVASSVGSPNFIGETNEELICQFLCRAADETLAQLRQLAADLRLDGISEQSASVLLRQRNARAALRKTCYTSLAF